MKFGQDLKNNIVPEWEHGYIAYGASATVPPLTETATPDQLKALIKKFSSENEVCG